MQVLKILPAIYSFSESCSLPKNVLPLNKGENNKRKNASKIYNSFRVAHTAVAAYPILWRPVSLRSAMVPRRWAGPRGHRRRRCCCWASGCWAPRPVRNPLLGAPSPRRAASGWTAMLSSSCLCDRWGPSASTVPSPINAWPGKKKKKKKKRKKVYMTAGMIDGCFWPFWDKSWIVGSDLDELVLST